MSTLTAEFDQLQQTLASAGIGPALALLTQQLREKKQYHELFEALKMHARHRIGLPVMYGESGDDLEPGQRTKLEDGLLEACREVGLLLLEAGRIREGWMYLRPTGEKKEAAAILRRIEPDEDNLDELVEVALQEGVDTKLGYQLVLDRFGTCNAITTFESQLHSRSRGEQKDAAALLVKHVHKELMSSVNADIARQEGNAPAEKTLHGLVADREWLFNNGSYHIDTTHLASTVRFARILDDPEYLRLAVDLTEYGRRLSSPFQYQGDEPFADIYPSHGLYLQALLGENVDEALAYFRAKAESLDIADVGPIVVEVYIDLLARLGRFAEAIDATIEMIPPGTRTYGHAPSLLELSRKAGSFDRYIELCKEHDDLLGFATGIVHEMS